MPLEDCEDNTSDPVVTFVLPVGTCVYWLEWMYMWCALCGCRRHHHFPFAEKVIWLSGVLLSLDFIVIVSPRIMTFSCHRETFPRRSSSVQSDWHGCPLRSVCHCLKCPSIQGWIQRVIKSLKWVSGSRCFCSLSVKHHVVDYWWKRENLIMTVPFLSTCKMCV